MLVSASILAVRPVAIGMELIIRDWFSTKGSDLYYKFVSVIDLQEIERSRRVQGRAEGRIYVVRDPSNSRLGLGAGAVVVLSESKFTSSENFKPHPVIFVFSAFKRYLRKEFVGPVCCDITWDQADAHVSSFDSQGTPALYVQKWQFTPPINETLCLLGRIRWFFRVALELLGVGIAFAILASASTIFDSLIDFKSVWCFVIRILLSVFTFFCAIGVSVVFERIPKIKGCNFHFSLQGWIYSIVERFGHRKFAKCALICATITSVALASYLGHLLAVHIVFCQASD